MSVMGAEQKSVKKMQFLFSGCCWFIEVKMRMIRGKLGCDQQCNR
jgi:hypothetical protein